MGTLIVPASGLVYLDANPIIYSVEKHPAYWPILQPLWQAAKGKTIEIGSSDLVLMEVLIGPLKAADLALVNTYCPGEVVAHHPEAPAKGGPFAGAF